MATSSSSSLPTWDVFLSFYGKDTRNNFTSHLYSALDQAGIRTYMDEPELEKGEEIAQGLLNAIHGSKMWVVILSENYAYSKWCLNELVEILSCKRTKNQVIPVFYYIDPSDLRYNKRSFGEAFESHKKRYSVDVTEKWKSVLAKIAELSGYHLKKDADKNESDTIQEIVETVALQASTEVLPIEEYLIGLDSAVEEIYKKLSMQSNDVRAIGICGMGGIGKTTTAKAFYNKYSNKFDISCFTEVVKQCSEGVGPLLPLLNQLLIKLLRRKDYKVPDVENGIRKLKQILSSKKALIVLDDLDQSSYSGLLVRLCKSFYDGSRIIITTTDTNLLNQLKVDISEVSVYMVKKLGQNDSSELFSYHACRKPTPPEMFRELTVSFVTYAGGVPLALKVLGSSLCGRTDVSFWKAKLQKVRKIPEKEIQKILELSYDELDRTEKAIFLDIAFFFVGKDKDDAVLIFKSCDFYPDVGIPILVERCLLTIDEDNKFKMHNLIQDLGRELGKSRGLFWRGAPEDMLKLKGKNKIEGLILDMSTQRQITTEIFEKLSNLRLLEINDAQDIKGNFKNLFCELRSIRWRGCPMTHLSSSFLPRKLVSLDVSSSKLKTLWKSPRAITQLTNLGHLNLARCYKLKLLPDQLGDINGLRMLDASHTAIEKLPDSISHLKSLVKLKLDGCRKLRELPEQFGNMEGLRTFDATYCAIRQLPDSFAGLINLVELNFYGCKKLKKLPEQFGNMEGLRLFDASFSAIEQLPDSFGRLINLADLQLSDCKNLTSISNCVWRLKFLRVLNVKYCSMLERLPEQLGKMQCLEEVIASGTAIEELPDSIGLLSKLQKLVVNNKLKYVPNSIWNLTSLAELRLIQKDTFKIDLPETVNNTKLECLSLRCNIRLWLPLIQSFSCLNTLTLMDEGQSVSSAKLTSLSKLSNLQYLTLYNCTSIGSSFPELPLNLTELSLFNHATLEQLPNLSTLKRLRKLDIGGCTSLQSLPPLPPHLQILKVCECTSLQDVPDLSMLKELETSSFIGCTNLKLRTLQETFPKVRPVLSSFRADLPNGEVAEWFSYKSSGSIVSFEAPPIFGDNFSGVSLWVFYTSCESRDTSYYTLEAVITNKTQGIENKYYMDIPSNIVGVAQYKVKDISGRDISIKSGDILGVLFRGSEEEVKVETCGIYIEHK